MRTSIVHRWYLLLLLCSVPAWAQVTLSAHVQMEGKGSAQNSGNVVLWLSPIGNRVDFPPSTAQAPRLVQRNKSFDPHVLVVPVGSVVEFPNRDPFFHNVFSLFEGKRFDLGLYEAGSTRDVRFDKAGISYIFCNIHAEMSAVVIALDTPYYGISNPRGEVIIPNVPAGRYTMHVFYEAALPDTMKGLTREISVSENSSTLGVIRLPQAELQQAHKNKYGRDYDQPVPAESPGYQRP
jgi:plastocyanin